MNLPNYSGTAVFLLPLQGKGRDGDGVIALSLLPHPYPNHPLEGEGIAVIVLIRSLRPEQLPLDTLNAMGRLRDAGGGRCACTLGRTGKPGDARTLRHENRSATRRVSTYALDDGHPDRTGRGQLRQTIPLNVRLHVF